MDLKTYLLTSGKTQIELARAVGAHPVVMSQWVGGVRRVPAEHCPAIERATNGAVRCEDLRSDVDWAYLRGTDCAEHHEAA